MKEQFKICKCGKVIKRKDTCLIDWLARKYCNNECYQKYRKIKNETP